MPKRPKRPKQSGVRAINIELSSDDAIALVKRNGLALQNIRVQTAEICLAAVKQNGFAISYVKEQTPQLCLAAVEQNGRALGFVRNQTPEICLAAVRKNPYAIYYVKDQTPELCLAAVQQNGCVLGGVRNQTLEICFAALKNDMDAVTYVKEKTPEFWLAAIQNNWRIIRYIEHPTTAMYLAAIRIDGFALSCVNEVLQTLDMCIAAVTQNPSAIHFVSERYMADVERYLREFGPYKLETLPQSVKVGELEDPITFEPPVSGNIYGFVVQRDRWFLAISLETAKQFITEKFRGSSRQQLFVPLLNRLCHILDIRWVKL